MKRRMKARNAYAIMAEQKRIQKEIKQELSSYPFAQIAQIDPSRRWEYARGGVMQEDNSAMANLPYGAFQKPYPGDRS